MDPRAIFISYNNAHQVIREVEQAHEREKVIVPVRLGLTHQQFIGANPILRI